MELLILKDNMAFFTTRCIRILIVFSIISFSDHLFAQCDIKVVSDRAISFEQFTQLKQLISKRQKKKIRLTYNILSEQRSPDFDILNEPYQDFSKLQSCKNIPESIEKVVNNGSSKFRVVAANEWTMSILNSICYSTLNTNDIVSIVESIIKDDSYKLYERIVIVAIYNSVSNSSIYDLQDFEVTINKMSYETNELIIPNCISKYPNAKFEWSWDEQNYFSAQDDEILAMKDSKIYFRQCIGLECGNPKVLTIKTKELDKKPIAIPFEELNTDLFLESENRFKGIYGSSSQKDVWFLYRDGIASSFYLAIKKDLNVDSAIMVIRDIECDSKKIASIIYTRKKSKNGSVNLITPVNSMSESLREGDLWDYDLYLLPGAISFSPDWKEECEEDKIQYSDRLYELMITLFDKNRKVYDSKKIKVYFSPCP
jgi:hypothetical protein